MPKKQHNCSSSTEQVGEETLQKLRARLSPNMAIFCDEWLIDRCGTRAYGVAYPRTKNARVREANASRLLSNDRVSAYISARLERIRQESTVSIQKILEEESRIAFSDIRDLFDGEDIIPPHELPNYVASAVKSFTFNKRTDKQTGETVATYSYTFWDKGKSLERLAKHLGMYEKDNRQKGYQLPEVISTLLAVLPPDIRVVVMVALQKKLEEQ